MIRPRELISVREEGSDDVYLAMRGLETGFLMKPDSLEKEVIRFVTAVTDFIQRWKRTNSNRDVSFIIDVLEDGVYHKETTQIGNLVIRPPNKKDVDTDPEDIVVERLIGGQPEHIANISKADLSLALGRIRASIREGLLRANIQDAHLVSKRKHRAQILDSQRVAKELIQRNDTDTKNLLKALEHLRQIKEPCPYVADIDSNFDEKRLVQMQPHIDLVTLEDLFEREPKPILSETFTAVTEIIKGLEFLKTHNLRLMDLDLSNIRINQETGHAQLFDLDGLRLQGTKVVYIAKAGFFPPEVVKTWKNETKGIPETVYNTPLTEDHAVYELGMLLYTILKKYPQDEVGPYYRLVNAATSKNPPRPPLREIQTILEEAITLLKEEGK